MKTSTIIWVILAIIVILGLGWWYFGNHSQAPTQTSQTTDTTSEQAASAAMSTTTTATSTATSTMSTAPMTATVTYSGHGFSPSTVTIAKGGTVTFVNQSSNKMWVASDPHPTHQGYDGTTRSQHCAQGYTGAKPFDQCSTGNSFTFTFTKTGSWGYHNHDLHQDTGTVVVQ